MIGRRLNFLSLLLLVIMLSIAGCGNQGSGGLSASDDTDTGNGNGSDSIGGETVESGPPTSIVLFSQQQIQTLAFDMALKQGFYDAANLDVTINYFPSGTTAFQSFQVGEGDIVYAGDIPSLNYFGSGHSYQLLAPVERNSKPYALVVKREITNPGDLSGRKLATRVGSTGSHFIDSYLDKIGLTGQVEVLNMDGPTMVSALCNGDIDGFFLWSPFPERAVEICGDKIYTLADAGEVVTGYYTMIGARPDWIEGNKDAVIRFLRASLEGQAYALDNKDESISHLNEKFGLDIATSEAQWDLFEHMLRTDADFYADMNLMADWALAQGNLPEPLDWNEFFFAEGLSSVDGDLVAPLPR